MREILFRGKRVDNGKWEFGSYFRHNNRQKCVIGDYDKPEDFDDIIIFSGSADWNMPRPLNYVKVDPSTVGQYTGLTDKNGKKIFEGDIVHYVYEPGKAFWHSNQNSVIEFRSTGFYMRCIRGTNKFPCSSGWLVTIPHREGSCFEVIGNIYDNPELLEEIE